MMIDVTKIKKILGQSFNIQFEQALETLELNSEDIVFAAPVRVKGTVVNTGFSLKVEANISAVIRRACGRCLEEFTQPVDTHFEVEFKSPRDKTQVEEDSTDGEDFLVYEGNTIDLTEVVKGNLLMAIPMKAVCRDDCLGICSTCGHSRNDSDCRCEDEHVDPRLQILGKFLKS